MRRAWLSYIVPLSLMGIVCSGCGGGGEGINASDPRVTELSAERQQDLGELIQEVEQADVLELRGDGTIGLQTPTQRSASLSPAAEAFATDTIAELNTLVAEGVVKVEEDFSVTPTDTHRFPRFVGWRWWGMTWYFGHGDIENGLGGVAVRLMLQPGKGVLVTGPIFWALNHVCSHNRHRGANLNISWALVWWPTFP